ncbi:MAG TPA: hypothetical protein VKU41_14215 [Polyangiaceae bacterium]|nr:hypothetical protein [Polyangiaceae bacterium]
MRTRQAWSSNCLIALCAYGAVAAAAGCSAADKAIGNVEGLTSGCDEFKSGPSAVDSLSIDGDTKAFVQASANLVAIIDDGEKAVLQACVGIDGDLGVPDTWSAKAPSKGAAPDAEVTEACNQAAAKISSVLSAAQAQCSLDVSPAHCTVDETAQVKCESSCTSQQTCQPGDITTLCSPAQLTGECDGSCMANAVCEGTVQTQAHCDGSCRTRCTGTCDSTPCNGTHCGGRCTGTCDGDCTVDSDAQVACGANVDCRGGCSVAYRAPKCETTVTPPTCNVSQSCQSSCKSLVESTSTCTPATVSLDCGGNVSSQVNAVVQTVGKNVPALVAFVQDKGTLALDAANEAEATGKVVADHVTTLGGKAISCSAAAVSSDATAAASLNVTVNASSSVSGACGGPMRQ